MREGGLSHTEEEDVGNFPESAEVSGMTQIPPEHGRGVPAMLSWFLGDGGSLETPAPL